MSDAIEIRCEHCGQLCEDEDDLEIGHRGCRFKHRFPGTYKHLGGGLLEFDMAKVAEQLKGDKK